jgi:hypothetical protein
VRPLLRSPGRPPSSYWKASSLGLADGTAVASWADSSASGNTLTQATAGQQPVYKAPASVPWLNGNPAVRFDGTDDQLTRTTGVASPTVAQSTLAMVIYIPAGTTNAAPFKATAGAGFDITLQRGNAQFSASGGGSSQTVLAGQWQISSGVHIVVVIYDGAQQHLYVDGTMLAYAATTGSITPTTLIMGALTVAATPNYPFKGDIAELVFYGTALTQAQLDQLHRGWAASYRMPVVTPF